MREESAGREVAVDAIRVLVEELERSSEGRQALQEVDLDARRLSWEQLCNLLDVAAQITDDLGRIGAAGIEAATNKFGKRSRIARSVLCLEEALSFILYPGNPIDFASIHPAITHEPGRVDVVAYLFA